MTITVRCRTSWCVRLTSLWVTNNVNGLHPTDVTLLVVVLHPTLCCC